MGMAMERGGSIKIVMKDLDRVVDPKVPGESGCASESGGNRATENARVMGESCGFAIKRAGERVKVECDLCTSSALLSGPRRAMCTSARFLQIRWRTCVDPLCSMEGPGS